MYPCSINTKKETYKGITQVRFFYSCERNKFKDANPYKFLWGRNMY